MNHPDDNLVKFLRNYRPDVPPPAPDLEQKIQMATIPRKSHQKRWLIPPAIAAGLLIAWTGYRSFVAIGTAQANLDAFLESSWDGILGGTADAQTFPLANPPSNQIQPFNHLN